MRSNIFTLLTLVVVTLVLAGCNKQDWDVTVQSEVQFKSSSNEVTIAGKPFIMDEITINLSEMKIYGERIQSGPVEVVLLDNGSTDFLSNVNIKPFDLKIGTYPEMYFSTAVVSNGTPSVTIRGTYYPAVGGPQEVMIDLNIDQDILTQLTDSDGTTTILVEENKNKSISLTLDTDTLFSALNPGLWNAAAVTSNNGSQTIVIDELNNNNIYNAISTKIGESFIVAFQ